MRILLTGATGYIGKRLLPVLLEQGHTVICCVRNRRRLDIEPEWEAQIEVFKADFSKPIDTESAPLDFDVAYYLIHSLSTGVGNFEEQEAAVANHFVQYMNASQARQIIYLSGIVNEDELSAHLSSRLRVEKILMDALAATTVLRAAIIVGSGSASFEIIRDLVEKLPLMIAPRWLNTRCQPLSIRDVIKCLQGVMLQKDTYNQHFDIGGADILTYKQMLIQYAQVRGLKRYIYTLPVMTPRLSSYWLYFITSTSYPLAVNLVNSMKIDVVAADNRLMQLLEIEPATYKVAVERAFDKIEQNMVLSSWKDSLVSSMESTQLFHKVEVPTHGCYFDRQQVAITNNSVEQVLDNIWSIGGDRGWYYGNKLWALRGYLDKLAGGVGLKRGRTNLNTISAGDSLDFWRVLVADQQRMRLLLYAEMKLPGEAWLEFKIRPHEDKAGQYELHQTATFRPEGLLGRLYWLSVLPFHFFIFGNMVRRVERYQQD